MSNQPKKTANVSATYAAVIEDCRADRKPKPTASLGDYYAAWERRVRAMEQVDLNEVDPRSIKASDVGFEMGPPMTEEAFREYRARNAHKNIQVIKTPPTPIPKPT